MVNGRLAGFFRHVGVWDCENDVLRMLCCQMFNSPRTRRMMLRANSIYSNRAILITLLAIILTASFTITNIINYNETSIILRKELIEEELPVEVERISLTIKLFIMPFLTASSNLAHDHFIHKWIKDGEPDEQFIINYIDSIQKMNGVNTCFLASEVSKTYYNSNGGFHISENDPDACWYFEFRESGKPYELNKAINVDMENMPTVFINHRIDDDNGTFLGVVGMGLELAAIPRILDQYSKSLNRSIYFVDADGNVVSRSDKALFTGANMFELTHITRNLEAIFSGKSQFFEYQLAGKTILVSTHYIPELNWWLFIEQDEFTAMKTANRVLLISIIINVISIIVTMSLVFLTASFFHNKLKQMAITDNLTGINNRLVFEHMLERAFAQLSRSESPFTVLILDLDHFKLINDTYGHLEGDAVLKKTVAVINSNIRHSDDLCRWGGEEFVILAHNCNLEQGIILAEKIRKAIKAACVGILPDGDPLTASIGVCQARVNEGAAACMTRADNALYKAKQDGRDCVRG